MSYYTLRRPIWGVIFFSGYYGNSAFGLVEEWRWDGPSHPTDAQAVTWLIDTMEAAYQKGYRDFILDLPCGKVNESSIFFSSAQWEVMPLSRRNELSTRLTAYIASKRLMHGEQGYTVAVYQGLPIRDDLDPSNVSMTEDQIHCPDPNNVGDAAWLSANNQGWIDIGVNRFWIDAASNTGIVIHGINLLDGAKLVKPWYDNAGVTMCGEAFPIIAGATPQDYTLDQSNLNLMPWLATHQFMDLFDTKTAPSTSSVTYNPATRILTSANGFASYSWQEGDRFVQPVLDNFLPTEKYDIARRIDASNIELKPQSQQRTATLPTAGFTTTLTWKIVNHFSGTGHWTADGNDMMIWLILGHGYNDADMLDLMNRGFRLGSVGGESEIRIANIFNQWLQSQPLAPAAPGPFFYLEFYEPAALTHRIWDEPNTCAQCRGFINEPTSVFRNPPGTGTTYPTPTTTDAVGAAIMIANWIEYHYDQLHTRYVAINKPFMYTIMPQNISAFYTETTDPANSFSAMRNYRDKVSTPLSSETNSQNYWGLNAPFSENGRALQGGWSETFYSTLKVEIDKRGLPQPFELHYDIEDYIDSGSACSSNGGGWLDIVRGDGRASSELVDGENSFEDLFAQAKDIHNNTFTYNSSRNMYGETQNYSLFNWLFSATYRFFDYVTFDSTLGPARNIWPNIKVSSYGLNCGTSDFPVYSNGKAYLYTYEIPHLFQNYQTPAFYPLFPIAFDPIGLTTRSTYVEWFALYGVQFTGNIQTDMGNLWIAKTKRDIDQMLAAGPGNPLIPSIPNPGWDFVFDATQYPGGGTFTTEMTQIREIMRYATEQGVDRWLMFWPDPTTEQLDLMVDLVREITDLYTDLFISPPSGGGGRQTKKLLRPPHSCNSPTSMGWQTEEYKAAYPNFIRPISKSSDWTRQ